MGLWGFCWPCSTNEALFILSLFYSQCLLRFPIKVENHVNLEPLELSLTIFSFISFILCIRESPRPLKCDLCQSLPPYSNPEPHPSSLEDWNSLLAGHPSLALNKSSGPVCWMNEWMNEWVVPLSLLFGICPSNFSKLSLPLLSPCLSTWFLSMCYLRSKIICLIFQSFHNQASPLLSKSYFQLSIHPCPRALCGLVWLSC